MGGTRQNGLCRVLAQGALGKVDFQKKIAECLALALGKISFKKLKKIAECPRLTLSKICF